MLTARSVGLTTSWPGQHRRDLGDAPAVQLDPAALLQVRDRARPLHQGSASTRATDLAEADPRRGDPGRGTQWLSTPPPGARDARGLRPAQRPSGGSALVEASVLLERDRQPVAAGLPVRPGARRRDRAGDLAGAARTGRSGTPSLRQAGRTRPEGTHADRRPRRPRRDVPRHHGAARGRPGAGRHPPAALGGGGARLPGLLARARARRHDRLPPTRRTS